MIWQTENQRSGWITVQASKLLAVDLPRIFAILNDPASWPVEQPERLVRSEVNRVLGYSFANGSRVELHVEPVKPGLQRLTSRSSNECSKISWYTAAPTPTCSGV